MTTVPPTTLLDRLRASGLLDAATLADLARLPEAADPDPRPLGRLLLQRKLLTRFQVNQLAAGRGHELAVGPYLLVDKLGEGGMGQVFKATHRHMARTVALKLIRKEKLGTDAAVRRFYQEVQAAAQLHHPNIVLAYDAGPAGAAHYFAMEYVDGVDLARLVKDNGPLPVPLACEYARQAAIALQHAHEKGLVHRDVKPHNLLLARGDGPPRVKLLDLGLARPTGQGETALTQTGQVLGTPDYLAPEQAYDSHKADGRSDVYGLGCTLYFLLTARPPFAGETLTQVLLKHQMEPATPLAGLRPDVPAGLATVVTRMMAKRPEERYQTPAEVAAALAPFARGEAGAAVPPLPVAQPAHEASDAWATLDDAAGAVVARPKVRGGRTDESHTAALSAGRWPPERVKRYSLIAAAVAVPVLGLLVAVVLALSGGGKPEPAPKKTAANTAVARKPPEKAPEDPPEIPPQPPDKIAEQPAVPQKAPEQTARQPQKQAENGKERPALPQNPIQKTEDVQPVARGLIRRLGTHDRLIRVAISPDSKQAFSMDKNRGRVWELLSGTTLRVIDSARVRYATAAAVSNDWEQVAIASVTDKVIRLYNLRTGQEQQELTGHESTVHNVHFSPNGKMLASVAGDTSIDASTRIQTVKNNVVRIWESSSGRLLYGWDGTSNTLAGVAFFPDGNRLLTTDHNTTWQVTDVNRRQTLFTGSVGARTVYMSAWPVDSDHLLLTRLDSVQLYELTTRKVIREVQTKTTFRRVACLFEGGKYAVLNEGYARPSSSKDNPTAFRVFVWDLTTGKVISRWPIPSAVITMAVARDGRTLLTGSEDGVLRLWDLTVLMEQAGKAP